MMDELERILIGSSAAAPAAQIVEDVSDELAHREIAGTPRTIYEEVWHIAFWLQITLAWIDGIETPYPEHASEGFPSAADIEKESWSDLRQRFLHRLELAVATIHDSEKLIRGVRCPSAPGSPVRTMTVREQLESLAAHNAYHFGRIVLMRQIAGAWPPPSGGDSW
jgi:uncharacterized damage-inducible protein DinB